MYTLLETLLIGPSKRYAKLVHIYIHADYRVPTLSDGLQSVTFAFWRFLI